MASVGKQLKHFVVLVFVALFLLQTAFATTSSDNGKYIKIDSSSTGKVSNLRLIAGDLYKFKKANSEVDPNFMPTKDGLENLCISGSAQYTEPNFRKLDATLRECAEGRTVYVFDLRQESHFFFNGETVLSLYGTHNWANKGMTLEEIETAEAVSFGSDLVGTTVQTYKSEGKPSKEIYVRNSITEKELVESEGFKYIRYPIPDHSWPSAEIIDDFISFVRSIDPDKVWLHFHCKAGLGRTGIMMMIYDMIRNPDVPMMDIVVRQNMMGANYVLKKNTSESFKVPLYEEKNRMTPLFYEYVQENYATGFEEPWSTWLEKHESQNPETAR